LCNEYVRKACGIIQRTARRELTSYGCVEGVVAGA
jgi:hypothetical protein